MVEASRFGATTGSRKRSAALAAIAKRWSSRPSPKLSSKQIKDHAVLILKPRRHCAAADRKSNGHRSIRSGDVRRSPHIVGGAHQRASSDPNAEAGAADPQLICPALIV